MGVSGGADSMCLLHLLHQTGYPVVAAHLDHMIRSSSGQDAELVARMCETWHIPMVLKRMDVKAYCRDANLKFGRRGEDSQVRLLIRYCNGNEFQGCPHCPSCRRSGGNGFNAFYPRGGVIRIEGNEYRTFLEQYSPIFPWSVHYWISPEHKLRPIAVIIRSLSLWIRLIWTPHISGIDSGMN